MLGHSISQCPVGKLQRNGAAHGQLRIGSLALTADGHIGSNIRVADGADEQPPLSGFITGLSAVHAPEDIMASILRYSSLGGANFEETRLGHPWELTVGIPASALFRHNIDTWQGLKARINLYKCGDRLSCRHYLSWRPIDSPKPDFHTPRCFVAVQF